MKYKHKTRYPARQAGVSVVHWLLAIVPLCGAAALAVDFNNVYLSVTELQNAADAGALEGARLLYNPDGTINIGATGTSAIDGATATALSNNSQGSAVEVASVNRGHWEFRTAQVDTNGIERGGAFTANATTIPAPLTNPDGTFRTWQELNLDPNEINAVEVVTERRLTPIQRFFGQFVGIDDYQITTSAVAYIGFAGGFSTSEIDFPIAMCQEILEKGCSVGRLVPEPDQTGGWTNIEPHEPEANTCGGAVSATEMRDMVAESKVCPAGSGFGDTSVALGSEIQVNNGQINSAFDDMYDCWMSNPALDTDLDGLPDQPMEWKLPVVFGCKFGGDCATVIGAVTVEVLWMFKNDPNNLGAHSIDNTAPRSMGTWTSSDPAADGVARWNEFVGHYLLQMDSSDPPTPATFENGGAIQKTIYFKPDCDPADLGGTGGANFGVRATVPVLVR